MDKVSETLQYLKDNSGFLKKYFKYLQLAQGGDEKAKQIISALISTNPEMFTVINELLKMANDGDRYAKQMILDHMKE